MFGGSGDGRERADLAEALACRRADTPVRVVAVGLTALVLHVGLGWEWAWLWAAGFVILVIIERWAIAAFLKGRPTLFRSLPALCATAAAALAFGSIAIPLTNTPGEGNAIAQLALAGGMVNAIIVSRASLLAFSAAAGPYAVLLIGIPVSEVLRSADHFGEPVRISGSLLLVAFCVSAWAGLARAVRSETAARRELNDGRRQAEAARDAKSAFVAMVSHELRTPLSGVLAAGEQLRAAPLEPKLGRAAAVVVDAGRHMHALLDELLDLAKIEAGRMDVETIGFDIGELILGLEHHWKAAADSAGKPLQLTSALNLPLCIEGDPTRLRQVLNNLLSNALKFTGPEGVRWTVEAVDDASLCWLSFRVTDSGPGITPERLEQLFTPFDQADVSIARTYGGTGLGLALSRELARLMGGDLRVESEIGQGSTFILSVPVTRAATAAGEAEAEPVAAPLAGLRVLVVDDHEINRRTAALILEAAGVEVSLVAAGEEALALLDVEPFDLVVTDVNMPGMNGLQLTQEINRRVGLNRSAPVLALTAGDSPQEQAACRAAGMRACVSKPIDARALYRAVEEACTGRERASQRVEVA